MTLGRTSLKCSPSRMVAVVSASGFGGKDGFRISFAADDALLAEAIARIAAALAPLALVTK